MVRRATRLLAGLLAAGCAAGGDKGATLGEADTSAADAAGAGDVPVAAGGDAATTPSSPGRAVYVATAGLATPSFVRLDAAGAHAAVRIGPERAAAYGLGEGDATYPELTPDGETLVVTFMSSARKQQALFALPVDGTAAGAPIRIASMTELWGELALTDTQIAWVDGGDLYAAPLDGSRADSPILVAKAPAGRRIVRPRWAGSRLVFEVEPVGGNSATISSAMADGSQAAIPVTLTAGSGQHRVQAVLGDGRIVYLGDGRLYAVTEDGTGVPVPLTPKGPHASLHGVTPDGARLVVELWTSPTGGPETLVSVDTLGQSADAPVPITPEPVEDLSVVLAGGGTRVVFAARGPDGLSAVFEGSTDASPATPTSRICEWKQGKLRVHGVSGDGAAVVTSDLAGAVLRVDRSGGPTSSPTILHQVTGVVNQSYPWPEVSGDGEWAVYTANTAGGWRTWATRISGGEPVSVSQSPDFFPRVGKRGLTVMTPRTFAAPFAVAPDGTPEPLAPLHTTPLEDPRLTPDGRYVLYRTASPVLAWYAARSDGADEGAHRRITPELPPTPQPYGQPPVRPLATAVASDRLLLARHGAATSSIESCSLDGANAEAATVVLELPPWAVGSAVVDEAGGRVVVAAPPGVVAARVDGSDAASPVIVLSGGGTVDAVALLPGGERAVAAVQGDGVLAGRLVSVALDGSDAEAPIVLTDPLAGWPMALLPAPSGAAVLLVLSIEATAVPHPDQLLVAGTDAAVGPKGVPLAPPKYVPWGLSPFDAPSPSVPAITPDGLHAILLGDGALWSARMDGSQAATPVQLAKSGLAPLGPEPLLPDGRILAHDDATIFVARAGVAASAQPIATPGGQVGEGLWAGGHSGVVFRAASNTAPAVLYAVLAEPGSPLVRLTPEGMDVGALVALAPGEGLAVFESRDGGDHSLYVAEVALSPGAAPAVRPLTPIDDATETLLGFATAP